MKNDKLLVIESSKNNNSGSQIKEAEGENMLLKTNIPQWISLFVMVFGVLVGGGIAFGKISEKVDNLSSNVSKSSEALTKIIENHSNDIKELTKITSKHETAIEVTKEKVNNLVNK